MKISEMINNKLIAGLSALALSFGLSTQVLAAPGVLAQEPLNISARVDPNIMLLIDNSGSMNHIVPDVPFNSSVTYFNCPASLQINTTNKVLVRVRSSGYPYFRVGNNFYEWGNTSGTGVLGFQKRCFANTATYNAALYANLTFGSGTRYADVNGYGDGFFTGNYLNWYFGPQGTNWGVGNRKRPDTQRRIEIARDAAINLVNDLEQVRVGLAVYNFSSGASILVGINDVANNKTTLISRINTISPSSWTPIAESLHEIGRYFVQGYNASLKMHPDTPQQVNKSAYDIFNRTPNYSSGVVAQSPIEYFCQKNFVVLLTDGLSTQDRDISTSTGLTDYDFDCQNASPACLSYDRKSGETYDTNGSDYLDDVAKALFDIDLRPDLSDFAGNPVKNNIVTYPIGFADSKITSAKLMTDTAANGGGVFLTANNAAELANAFEAAAESILAQAGTAASITLNSASLSAGAALYATEFSTARWSGNLRKFPVDEQGNIGAEQWNVVSLLAAMNPNNRFIFTINKDTGTAVEFKTLGNLSAAQQADLNTGPGGVPDLQGQLRINYLRGDRSLEDTIFRKRSNILADIVHSGVLYIGPSESAWPSISPFPTTPGKRHEDFVKAMKNRPGMVYTGDNGGFFHVFDGNNGAEKMVFIPNKVFSSAATQGLHYLTNPTYQHRYYVDLPPVAEDVYINSKLSGGKSWRTVVVGGERGGGQGYFILDATSPANFTPGKKNQLVLGEFTNDDNADLGYAFSVPVIGLMNNGRWAMIFGNGYNNTGSGQAKLFIVYLDGGLNGSWTLNSDYVVLDTKRGSLSNNNGLASPSAIDTDGNGTIDRIYAGDLRGNLWVFDVSSSTTTSWGPAYGNTSSPTPLFRNGSLRPFTAKPVVVKNPEVGDTSSNTPNMIVMVGTGQYLTEQDKTNTDGQRFYGIWDSGTGNLRPNDLVRQNILASSTATKRVMSDKTINYGTNYGWRIHFSGGERVINGAATREGIVFFTTLIPNNSEACSFGGSGWVMAVKVKNGGEPDEVVIDVNNDDQLDDTDKLNNRVVSGLYLVSGIPATPTFRRDYLFVPTSDGTISSIKVIANENLTGRISWRELTGSE